MVKFLLTHTDGENTGLLEHYLESNMDVADSVCPKPMTKLSFKEVRDHFDGSRFSLPARGYTRPLDLFIGYNLSQEHLSAEIDLPP